jgi:hypothetical protein
VAGCGSCAAWFEGAHLRKKRHPQALLWSLGPESHSPQHPGGEGEDVHQNSCPVGTGGLAFYGRSWLAVRCPHVAHDHNVPSAWGLQGNGAFRSFISKMWLRVMWRNGAGAVERAHESWVAPILGADVAGRRGRFVQGVDKDTKMVDWAGLAGVR